MILLAVKFRV